MCMYWLLGNLTLQLTTILPRSVARFSTYYAMERIWMPMAGWSRRAKAAGLPI